MDIRRSIYTIQDRIHVYITDAKVAVKIYGYLLLFCTPEELIEYASSSDRQFHALIVQVNNKVNSWINQTAASHMPWNRYISPASTISRPVTSPSSFQVPAWQPHLTSNEFRGNLHIQPDLPVASSNYHYSNAQLGGGLDSRGTMSSTSAGIPPSGMIDCSPTPCAFFKSGLCKHGGNCRFSHGSKDDIVNNDHGFSPVPLEKLSVEISEILKENKRTPISIADLPNIYLDKYGKKLQAEDYLTQSQRRGKAGCTLTELLVDLKTILLIERPRGQLSVVLAEDVTKYMKDKSERSDPGSCRIYLTFPAESTFTEDDVLNYFRKFGPVDSVYIPPQEKRTFGFVTFKYPVTVKRVLENSQLPHLICGSRVMAKPYKDKFQRPYGQHSVVLAEDVSKYRIFLTFPADSTFSTSDVHSFFGKFGPVDNVYIPPQEKRTFGFVTFKYPVTVKRVLENSQLPHLICGSRVMAKPYKDKSQINYPSADEKPRLAGDNCRDEESGSIELPDNPFE